MGGRERGQHALVFVVGFNPTFLLPSTRRLLPGGGEIQQPILSGGGCSLHSPFFGYVNHIGGFHLGAQRPYVCDNFIVELKPGLVTVPQD